MNPPHILIACIGNVLLGDAGFGVELARRLASCSLPPEVTCKDFGIRIPDLTDAPLHPYGLVILVDACRRGGKPGALYLLEPEPAESADPQGTPALPDTENVNRMDMLRVVQSMGGKPGRLLILGCEPEHVGPDKDGKPGLSDAVKAAIDEAVVVIEMLVTANPESEQKEIVLQAR